MGRPLDVLDIGGGLSRPGMDTRQWASFGIVDQETPNARSVSFDPSLGPLVNVTLQPSNIPVVCRVANAIAGQDEGEWFPFLPGDEVEVIINEGNERAGCVIVGRLYNEIDKWPSKVAGQDATKNTFGFRRLRTPYILETASSYMLRSALTGANLTIDQKGNLFLVSGDGHQLVFSADFMKIGEADGDTFFQIDMDKKEALIQVNGDAQYLFSDDVTSFTTPGSMQISTAGTGSLQHGITLEQVVNLLCNFAVLLKTTGVIGIDPLVATPAALATAMGTMLLGATSLVIPTDGVPISAPFGNYITMPTLFGPTGQIGVALLAQALGSGIDPTGFIPGIGRTNLYY